MSELSLEQRLEHLNNVNDALRRELTKLREDYEHVLRVLHTTQLEAFL